VHDDRELARDSDDRTTQAASLGNSHAPRLQHGPPLDPCEQSQRRLDEDFTHRPVAGLGKPRASVNRHRDMQAPNDR
jgi:hypothetical protein